MVLHASTDVNAYAAQVTAYLEREAVERNVLLTVIGQARQRWAAWTAPPQFWWMTAGDDVVGAASWTPPFALLVSSMPETAMAQLAAAALQRATELGIDLRGVSGPTGTALAIAETCAGQAGGRVAEHMRMVVHELTLCRTPSIASSATCPLPSTRRSRCYADERRSSGERRVAGRPLVPAWLPDET